MSLILAAFGGLGMSFARMGLINKKHAAGGGNPIPGTPTYYILGF